LASDGDDALGMLADSPACDSTQGKGSHGWIALPVTVNGDRQGVARQQTRRELWGMVRCRPASAVASLSSPRLEEDMDEEDMNQEDVGLKGSRTGRSWTRETKVKYYIRSVEDVALLRPAPQLYLGQPLTSR
jgi:hypothetical protein